jgi:hypothetical protein
MAKVTGGILGRASGKVSGIVFGGARSRTGKVVTAREKVIPANPNTASQQAQRSNFQAALAIVRGFGPDVYSDHFNRAIGQLPGFQSLMSIVLNNRNEDGTFKVPPATPLGTLHYPTTLTITSEAVAGQIDVYWSQELGDNGTDNDECYILVWAADHSSEPQYVASVAQALRSNGEIGTSFEDLDEGETYIVGLFLVGSGTALGLLSQAKYDQCVVKE